MSKITVRAMLMIPAIIALSPTIARADAICLTCMAQNQVNPLNTAGVTTNQNNLTSMLGLMSAINTPAKPLDLTPPTTPAATTSAVPKNHLVNIADAIANSTRPVQLSRVTNPEPNLPNWRVGGPLPIPGQQQLDSKDILEKFYYATTGNVLPTGSEITIGDLLAI